MPNVAISALPTATAAASTDVLPIVQGGTTKQLTNALLFTAPAIVTGTTATTPTAAYSLVNKQYVDAQINGLTAQVPCDYGSTAALTATYANGSSGVGATLTASANGVFTVDGATPAVAKRILIKDQTVAAQNGAYTVTSAGSVSTAWVLTRATDYDLSAEMDAGDGFYIELGSTLTNTLWVQTTPAPIVVGTSSLVFTQFANASFAKPIIAAMIFGGNY